MKYAAVFPLYYYIMFSIFVKLLQLGDRNTPTFKTSAVAFALFL